MAFGIGNAIGENGVAKALKLYEEREIDRVIEEVCVCVCVINHSLHHRDIIEKGYLLYIYHII